MQRARARKGIDMRLFYNLRVRFPQSERGQNEVARLARMAPSTMTTRMTGRQPFTAWEMDAIAEVLEIPREEYGKYFFTPRTKEKGRPVQEHQSGQRR